MDFGPAAVRAGGGLALLLSLLLTTGTVACSRRAPAAGEPGGQGAAVADPRPKARALAVATSEWPYLSVEVLEARRVSATRLTLTLAFINGSRAAEQVTFGSNFAEAPADLDTIAGIYLVDPGAARRYYVLRDRENRALCSSEIPAVVPGERRVLTVSFPAPPPSTTMVGIRIPHVAPIDQVPIGGGNW